MDDREKIMQEIVDMAKAGKGDAFIANKLSLPVIQVFGIRRFWGIGRARGIDIFNDTKKTSGYVIQFGLGQVFQRLGLDPTKNYTFKAIDADKKNNTLTIKFYDAD